MSLAAQIAQKEHLPGAWQRYCLYASQVVLEYHNDEGPDHDIHLDSAMGVRVLGENVLPNADLLGSGCAPDNPRWRWLRQSGNLHWRGKYVKTRTSSRRLLEFRVMGSTLGSPAPSR